MQFQELQSEPTIPVATEDQVIVACDVVSETNDFYQLKPMVEQDL